jgi:hypothetical protein
MQEFFMFEAIHYLPYTDPYVGGTSPTPTKKNDAPQVNIEGLKYVKCILKNKSGVTVNPFDMTQEKPTFMGQLKIPSNIDSKEWAGRSDRYIRLNKAIWKPQQNNIMCPIPGEINKEELTKAIKGALGDHAEITSYSNCIYFKDEKTGLKGELRFVKDPIGKTDSTIPVLYFRQAGTAEDIGKCIENFCDSIPDNMLAGYELTKALKDFFIDKNLFTVEDPETKKKKSLLEVGGNSMGGGIAEFSAALNDLKGFGVNGMALGGIALACIDNANKIHKRKPDDFISITNKGDFASDGKFLRFLEAVMNSCRTARQPY